MTLEVGIKTSVSFCASLALYSNSYHKNKVGFLNKAFMAALKLSYYFILFTVIIAMGTSSILFAIRTVALSRLTIN